MSDSDSDLTEEIQNKKLKSKHLPKKRRRDIDFKIDKSSSKKLKLKTKRAEASNLSSDDESDDGGPMERDLGSKKKFLDSDEDIEDEKINDDDEIDAEDTIDDEDAAEYSDAEEASDDSEDNESDQQTEFSDLRKEMSEMPLEDLQKLKEMIGVKSFSMAMSGGKVSQKQHKGKRIFKRENKNRPMEMSSKRPVKIIPDNMRKSKKLVRDPRFDDLSGEYKEEIFNKSYSFLGDIKQREKQKLEKKLKKEKNPEKKTQLQYLVNRMSQQEHAAQQKASRLEQDRSRKQQERQLVKEGKTPFYLKQADKKKLELAEKYKELNKSSKVDKYLSKKRKKNAAKERKKLPLQAAGSMPS